MQKMEIRPIAIINAKLFDGNQAHSSQPVIIKEDKIITIGGPVPPEAQVVDGKGGMLLPGLIDAHTHSSVDSLRNALKFGVTTELEMMGGFTQKGRMHLRDLTDIADIRSAGMGLTAPGGHPDELIPKGEGIPDFVLKEMQSMTPEEKAAFIAAHEAEQKAMDAIQDVTTEKGAIAFVHHQYEKGADYFKIMIEEGTVMNAPHLPVLDKKVMQAAVQEAQQLGLMTIAHALTASAARTAIEIGIDGLAHLFIDRPDWTPDLIRMIADSGAFVTPCLVLNASIIGHNASALAHDARVRSKLDAQWMDTMCSCFHTFPEGNMQDNYSNVIDLFTAGVDILVGTDVSVPVPHLGGLAHGVSVHHELQLLVQAGFSPTEALRAATSVTARRFALRDRGRLVQGGRADLVLVNGDPTRDISDTLSIIQVWKAGRALFDREAAEDKG